MSEVETRLAAIKAKLDAEWQEQEDEPTRLEGHLNSAEYWLKQADNYDFPSPIRAECLMLASTHAILAQAIAVKDR